MIMAGGTGGHIFPGLAVAARLSDASVSWLGSAQGLENQLVPEQGYELFRLNIKGLRGKGLTGWILAPFRVLKAVLAARKIFRSWRPGCVLSMGGYAAGPGGLAAWLSGIPLVVHEQNRIAGLTNKVLARFAKSIFEGFPDTFKSQPKVRYCGNPVRAVISGLPHPKQRLEGRDGPLRVLVLGGSQGAAALNRLVPEAVAMAATHDAIEVRHQAGLGHAEATLNRYRQFGIDAQVSEFIKHMEDAYGWADLLVCRAGALTIAEISAAGVAAILVPFPFAVDDHQTRNAEYLQQAGAARILAEAGLTAAGLSKLIAGLCGNRERLQQMAVAARDLAATDAAEQVANRCLELARS